MGWSTEFETGLLDDFDFTIERAYYAPDAKYNDGNTLLLQLEGSTDNVDTPTTTIKIPLGKGWETRDGGKTIVHESGREGKYFVKTSLMAKLITRCVTDFDMGDLLDARGDAFTAAVWEGLQFHMKAEMVDFGGGNIEPKSKVLPNRFLGVASEGSGAGAPASAPAAAPAASGESAADKIARVKAEAAAKANGNGTSALRSSVIAALKANDFDTDAALNVAGVSDDDALLAELLDGDSAIWAEARA